MAQDRQVNKRKHYYVKKEFQFKFILRFCLLLLLGIVISTTLLILFSQDTLTTSFQESRLVIKRTGFAILPSVIYINLITLGLVTIATVIVTLFVSHKIAGPLLRLEKEIKNIGEGDLTKKIEFRGNDQITELCNCINEMTKGLHEKIIDIRSDIGQISDSDAGIDTPDDIRKQLDQLIQKIENNFNI